ncbi:MULTISPECIES: molybdate ABC transporter permease subunit [Burkholderia]|uniref:Molybdenum transport system permease n=1 Tax=Burkholderia savannae TaxID=1637837 RepID=A0ABR5T848_9BURK|nr:MULTISPECIES: molybdate ABC transporter permease subunit [Burkholderia]AOJ83689.1 molybdenum ABC transporter permease [Burkholderia savannae]AOK50058.1 molybdenum ABC transporter permease [Burkholderia sp. MSMB617WGS]KVK86366.1 molybdenum ABC transporter permease [Burkholderia sp. MSMB1498]KWZ38299.1 molybdenum ABC transporter permease [Burkholderia savannae]KWZ47648.1 molybdenum ABC transporter permease [Burkholderia savannae]
MSDFLQRIDWPPLLLSLKVAGIATVLASIVGIALGWLFARRRFPGHAICEAACMLPLVLPPTVIGYGILVAAGRRSALGAWIYTHFAYTFVFNWHGAVLASAIVALPLVLKSASAAFAGVDGSLEAAARTLRQSPFSTFVRVTLPLAWPAILAGALLAFARAMGEFGATLMIAGDIPRQTQTLSLAIYDAMQDGRDGTAFFLACVTSGLSIAVLVLSKRFFTLR